MSRNRTASFSLGCKLRSARCASLTGSDILVSENRGSESYCRRDLSETKTW